MCTDREPQTIEEWKAAYFATRKDLDAAKNKAADAWVTGHQNHQLRWGLNLAKQAILQACATEDGLDTDDGLDLVAIIDRKLGMRKIENEMTIIAMQEKIEAADKMLAAAETVITCEDLQITMADLVVLRDLDVAANDYGKVKVPLP